MALGVVVPVDTLSEHIAAVDHLITRLTWDLERRWERQLGETHGLTGGQYRVLTGLLDAGHMHMSALADGAGYTLATMTGIVDRLVRRGLVERGSRPGDRRVILISLTDAGQEAATRALNDRRARLADAYGRMAPTDRLDLLTSLGRFADACGLPVA